MTDPGRTWSFDPLTGDGWAILDPDEPEPQGDDDGSWSAPDAYGVAVARTRETAVRIVAAMNAVLKPEIVCLCGDAFPTTAAMGDHIRMVHEDDLPDTLGIPAPDDPPLGWVVWRAWFECMESQGRHVPDKRRSWDTLSEQDHDLDAVIETRVATFVLDRMGLLHRTWTVEDLKAAMRKAWGPFWKPYTDPDTGAVGEELDVGAYAAAIMKALRPADPPQGEPFDEKHWSGTAAGRSLIRWIGHLWHNEGLVSEEVAFAIRGAVAAIEAEARGSNGSHGRNERGKDRS